MQKKILISCFLVLSLALIFCSCEDEPNPEPSSVQEQNQNQPSNDDAIDVAFTNASSYAVNVFVNAHRRLGGSVLATVPTGQTISKQLSPSAISTGDVFYFEYSIPIGSVSFPYFSFNNTQAYVVASGKENQITIGELVSCPTKSSYLVIENQTTSSAYLVNGSSILTPESQNSYYIDAGKGGVFLLGQNNEAIYYQNTNLLKIQIGTKSIPLPDITFSLGTIYSITVTDTGAALKSVLPFDIDTQKQIWTFDDSTFAVDDSDYMSNKPLLRSCYNPKNGSLILGTLKSDNSKIALVSVDVYKNRNFIDGASFSNSNYGTLMESSVLDFIEQSDGSIVMLLENVYESDDDIDYSEMLVCYNFKTRSLLWSLDLNAEYRSFVGNTIGTNAFYFDFYTGSKNTIYKMNDNKIALVGAVFTSDTSYPFFTVVDAQDYVANVSKGYTIHNYISSQAESENDKQSIFTSVYFDGNDFYVSGYENWDFSYDTINHTGTVYKFSGDLSSWEKVYSKDRCLFFCIDGVGSNWYTCGEYCDSGKILKGCYYSSQMLSQNADIALHTSVKQYCWFSELCCYDGKIILYGTTSLDKAAEESPLPIVASYSSNGKLLWENKNYTKYKQAYSLVPNAIGTYLLQLKKPYSDTIHYVSADLLGNEKIESES